MDLCKDSYVKISIWRVMYTIKNVILDFAVKEYKAVLY